MSTTTERTNDVLGQTIENFENALKTGVKMQEDYARWFTETLGDLGSPQDWQGKVQAVLNEAIQMAQRNVDEGVRMMNQNTKTVMEMVQRALDVRQVSSTADAQAKTREIWETALGALRTNTEAVVQANSRMLESWSGLATKLRSGAAGKQA
jgi:hypothetical protein